MKLPYGRVNAERQDERDIAYGVGLSLLHSGSNDSQGDLHDKSAKAQYGWVVVLPLQ